MSDQASKAWIGPWASVGAVFLLGLCQLLRPSGSTFNVAPSSPAWPASEIVYVTIDEFYGWPSTHYRSGLSGTVFSVWPLLTNVICFVGIAAGVWVAATFWERKRWDRDLSLILMLSICIVLGTFAAASAVSVDAKLLAMFSGSLLNAEMLLAVSGFALIVGAIAGIVARRRFKLAFLFVLMLVVAVVLALFRLGRGR